MYFDMFMPPKGTLNGFRLHSMRDPSILSCEQTSGEEKRIKRFTNLIKFSHQTLVIHFACLLKPLHSQPEDFRAFIDEALGYADRDVPSCHTTKYIDRERTRLHGSRLNSRKVLPSGPMMNRGSQH
jgi:hypothetical protein